MKNKKLLYIVQAALIAALYIVLTMLVKPIASGPLQFRVSEALVLLPAFLPAAIPGLWLGCVLANVLTGYGWVDIVFGGGATLLAALTVRFAAKKAGLLPEEQERILSRRELSKRKGVWLLPLAPVLFNGLIVGAYLPIFFPSGTDRAIWAAVLISMGQVAFSEAVVVYVLGIPFYLALHPYFCRRKDQIAVI